MDRAQCAVKDGHAKRRYAPRFFASHNLTLRLFVAVVPRWDVDNAAQHVVHWLSRGCDELQSERGSKAKRVLWLVPTGDTSGFRHPQAP
jgi:hypothetical protein